MLKFSAMLVIFCAGAALLWRVSSLGAGEFAKHPGLDSAAVKSAVRSLQTAAEDRDLSNIRTAVSDAVTMLGEDHFATQMLLNAQADAQADVNRLRTEISRIIESLTFRPWMEAQLPDGFPEFTPVHHIEVKALPGYRMARASLPSARDQRGNQAFWKLFNHIQRNSIAMTAPVQMDYRSSTVDSEMASMAFLYGSPETGTPGRDLSDSTVEVIDNPPQIVVSIGLRGRMNQNAVDRGHRALLSWLTDRKSEYRSTGPLRRMGYNSPFIPEDRSFYELQIPVEKISGSST